MMKDKSTLELGQRLNQIRVEMLNLWLESNKIIEELHERLPHLKNDPDFKIRKLERKRYERNFEKK